MAENDTDIDRVLNVRNFEIELVWKRATFFWALQLALLTALGLMLTRDPNGNGANGLIAYVSLALATLGVLVALSGFLASRGSKYWQSAWEKKLEQIEAAAEKNEKFFADYAVIESKWFGAGPFSVSKQMIIIQSYFIIFWILIFLFIAGKILDAGISISPYLFVALSTSFGCAGAVHLWVGGRTDWRSVTDRRRRAQIVSLSNIPNVEMEVEAPFRKEFRTSSESLRPD